MEEASVDGYIKQTQDKLFEFKLWLFPELKQTATVTTLTTLIIVTIVTTLYHCCHDNQRSPDYYE